MNLDRAALMAEHAMTLHTITHLLIHASEYFDAVPGSGAEDVAEVAMMDTLSDATPDAGTAGHVILALTSIILTVAQADDVQAWLDKQATEILETLSEES